MQEFNDFWGQADSVGRAVAALLLLMSISAWRCGQIVASASASVASCTPPERAMALRSS